MRNKNNKTGLLLKVRGEQTSFKGKQLETTNETPRYELENPNFL